MIFDTGLESGSHVLSVDDEIWRAQLRNSQILDHYKKLDDGSNIPVNRDFERAIAASVDGVITETLRNVGVDNGLTFAVGVVGLQVHYGWLTEMTDIPPFL